MHPDHPLPDNPSILASMLARRTATYFDRELKQHGIGFSQYRMLGFLYRHGDVPVMQEDIRAFLGHDKGSVAHSIRRLVDEGYISRSQNPDDKRAYEIHLTKKGEEFRTESARIADVWSDQLLDGLSDEERTAASDVLKRMLGNACATLSDGCEGYCR